MDPVIDPVMSALRSQVVGTAKNLQITEPIDSGQM
jgi:hypothetical protein